MHVNAVVCGLFSPLSLMGRLPPSSYITIGIFFALQAVFVVLRKTWSGVDYYRLRRIHNIVNWEFLMLIGSWYIWKRLTSALRVFNPTDVTPARLRWRSICFQDVAKALLFLFIAFSHISFAFYFAFLGENPHILALCSLTALAAYLHVFIFLLLAHGIHLLCSIFKKYNVAPELSNYIITSKDMYALLAVFCAGLFILGGLYSTFRDPVYTKITVPMRKFAANSEPVKIALLSDIHIGPTVGRDRMSTIVELTNKLKPDYVAISGDLADGFVRDLKDAAEPLCWLKPKYGVFFATGNHEYMHGDVDEWFDFLRGCNITVLHNDFKRIDNGENTVCIAGMDDLFAEKSHFTGHGMNPKKAMSGCDSKDAVVLLAHQPNAARIVLQDPTISEKVDLILSGHTHGGQMYLFVPIVYAVNAFTRGLYQHPPTGAYVYVSAGVNFFGPPVKMFGACEIIDITLVPTRH